MILDVGCGHNIHHLKKGDVGIDLQKGLCDIQAPAYNLPFNNSSFDKIIMGHVLEHLMNLGTALKEVKRVLKPDGVLLIEVPNPSCFWIFKDYVFSRKAKLGNISCSKDHVCCFGESELQNLLRFIGFNPVTIHYKTTRYTWIQQKSLVKRLFYIALFRLFPAFQNALIVTCIKK